MKRNRFNFNEHDDSEIPDDIRQQKRLVLDRLQNLKLDSSSYDMKFNPCSNDDFNSLFNSDMVYSEHEGLRNNSPASDCDDHEDEISCKNQQTSNEARVVTFQPISGPTLVPLTNKRSHGFYCNPTDVLVEDIIRKNRRFSESQQGSDVLLNIPEVVGQGCHPVTDMRLSSYWPVVLAPATANFPTQKVFSSNYENSTDNDVNRNMLARSREHRLQQEIENPRMHYNPQEYQSPRLSGNSTHEDCIIEVCSSSKMHLNSFNSMSNSNLYSSSGGMSRVSSSNEMDIDLSIEGGQGKNKNGVTDEIEEDYLTFL